MSAIQIRFVKSGVALLTFTDTNYTVLSYNMNPAAPEVETTTETMKLRIRGSSYADARSKWQALASVIHQVNSYFDNPGKGNEPVYMQFKLETTDTWYRTMLLPGTKLTNINTDITQRNSEALCNLHIVRTNYFENITRTELAFSNSNGDQSTSPKVYLSNDGTGAAGSIKENWIEYAAQTGFDLPAPVRFIFQTTSAHISRWYIGNFEFDHVFVTSAIVTDYYEWEDATGDGTSTVDAACSAGDKRVYTLDSDAVRTSYMLFQPTAEGYQYVQGKTIRPFIRWGENTDIANIKVRLRILVDITNTVYASDWVVPTTHLICEMPLIPLPMAGKEAIGTEAMKYYIAIDIKRTTAATETVSIDFFEFIMANTMTVLDKNISTEATGAGGKLYLTPYDEFCDGAFIDYAPDPDVYYSNWMRLGNKPVMIKPGKAGFFVFCWRGTTGAFGEYGILSSVGIQYYKRRLAL